MSVSLLTAFAFSTSRAAEIESLILPGIDLSSAELRVGDWVRYLVIDEAEGAVDSSMVTFSVTGEKDGAYWIEIATVPQGSVDGDMVRVLIDGAIKTYAYGDSLYRYVREIYVRKGSSPAEPGDPKSVRKLTLSRSTTDAGWARTPGVTLQTPAGALVCELREMTVVDRREVPAGRVTVIRNHEDRFRVWVSESVPVFHLSKCVIDRIRESRTVPSVRGIPDAGPRTSKTTSLLVAFGSDATPTSP